MIEVAAIVEPESFAEAVHDPHWAQVIDEEMHSLYDNETWDLLILSPGTQSPILG